jgi:hypothetical protein
MEATCIIAMITVVTGLPRSGTSLAMQRLEAAEGMAVKVIHQLLPALPG